MSPNTARVSVAWQQLLGFGLDLTLLIGKPYEKTCLAFHKKPFPPFPGSRFQRSRDDDDDDDDDDSIVVVAVSYTHLTLPTIYSV